MIFIYIIIFIYLCFMIWLLDGYKNISKNYIKSKNEPFVSIVVAVKNEENNIANLINCLKSQNYSTDKYEIIICNDQSTDNTLKIINNLKHDLTNLSVIDIKSIPADWSSKKWALYNGIKRSKGEIILQTDADCTMSNNWIAAITSQFSDETVGFVTSLTPLVNRENTNFYNKILFLDSIGIDAFNACSIGKGLTLTATARSIAYKKKYFFQVRGYDEINDIISGDDDLLLHKIISYVGCKIKYILHKDAIVYSKPPETLNAFINQRMRFASKGFIYYKKSFISNELKIILPFLYIVNLSIAVSLIYFCYNPSILYLLPFIIKVVPDLFFIYTFRNYVDFDNDWFIVIFSTVIHPFYIIFFGLLGPLCNFKWK